MPRCRRAAGSLRFLSRRPVARCAASRAQCIRMSGTATISQKLPRVTGPSANSRDDGWPSALSSAPCSLTSRPRPRGSGTSEPAPHQVMNKRIVARTVVGFRTGAVDDPGEVGRLDLSVAWLEGDPHLRVARGDFGNTACTDRQLAAGHCRMQLSGDDRCHAVAVDVPPGPQVAEEPPPLFDREATPQILQVRPQAIDHAAPAQPSASASRTRRRSQRVSLVIDVVRGRSQAGRFERPRRLMHLRQQAAPRHCPNRPAVLPSSSDRTTSTMVSPVPISSTGACLAMPATASGSQGSAKVGPFIAIRWQVARGEHDGVEAIAAAAGNDQRNAVGGLVQRHRLIRDKVKVRPLPAGPQLIAKQAADVGAIATARDEQITIRLAFATLGTLATQPFDKMVRPVLKCAHVAGADVQQVVLIDGRISEASTETSPLLDQIDAGRPAGTGAAGERQAAPR